MSDGSYICGALAVVFCVSLMAWELAVWLAAESMADRDKREWLDRKARGEKEPDWWEQ